MSAYAPLIDLAGLEPGDGYMILGPRRGSASGWSVTAGDFNRDHLADLMIGAPVAEAGFGVAHVVYGAEAAPADDLALKTLTPAQGFSVTGPEAETNLATGGAAGDLNGDGVKDLIIAAQLADTEGELDSGAVFVVFGQRGGAPAALDLSALDGTGGFKVEGHAHAENLGCAVAAGDLNGDGIDDLIVGAPSADPELEHHSEIAHEGNPRGVTYVFYGREDGWPEHLPADDADIRFIGAEPEGRAGTGVAAGDFDGDGTADLIVGAQDSDTFAGLGYVLYGGGAAGEVDAALLDAAHGVVLAGFPDLGGGGRNLAAGDLNGDGRADAVFAAPTAAADTGVVLVAFGRARGGGEVDLSTPDGLSAVRLDGLAAGDQLGGALEVGDLNGDGIADLVIAAPGADIAGRVDAGAVYVVFGRAGGWDPVIDLSALDGDDGYVLAGHAAGARMGHDLAIGDTDGDRLADLAIGGWEGGNQTGQTAVVLGRLTRETVTRLGTAADDLVHGGLEGDVLGGRLGDDLVLGHRGSDAVTGGDGDDRLLGGGGADTLGGGADEDLLRGGKGDDVLSGGRGADSLSGGAGADRFVFAEQIYSRPSDPDVIANLEAGDLIDVSAIDANDVKRGDQAFVLVEFFTAERGQATLTRVGDDTLLQLDSDGDAKANAAILLLGDHTDFTGFVF